MRMLVSPEAHTLELDEPPLVGSAPKSSVTVSLARPGFGLRGRCESGESDGVAHWQVM